ncbi:MAG: ABC transporter ATP-binding protein [Acidobacteria bacterium]|nr:ABC transporter ATP-binding protein [Acidobacteriota bacterium]
MLKLDNLSKRYGNHGALRNLSLKVEEGSAFALIGANGAGKTTTIKLLMNILQPDAGSAQVFGVDSRNLTIHELARIGYVSENQKLPAALSLAEYLAYLRPFYPTWDHDLERKVVAMLRLPVDRKISQLSHGNRMKAALACALCYHPELLILDEPFNGLDPLIRDEFMEGVLHEAGQMTLFISTHDLSDIETFATDVAFLSEGRLLFQESMESLMQRHRAVNITLDDDVLPETLPSSWINRRQSGSVLSFIDSHFSEKQLHRDIEILGLSHRHLEVEPIGLRSVFTATARATSAEAYEEVEIGSSHLS